MSLNNGVDESTVTKSERNKIIKWANTLTDDELEEEYYYAIESAIEYLQENECE